LKVEIENLSQTPPKLQRSGTMMASSLDHASMPDLDGSK
jgi:hypothetical protein